MFDYEHALKQLKEEMNVDFVGLATPTNLKSEKDVTWKYVYENINDRYRRIHLRRGFGIAGIVMKTGRMWIERNISKPEVQYDIYRFPIVNLEELTSFLAVPLWKYNKVVGVLLLANREYKPLSDSIETDIMRFLANGFGPFYPEDVINHENAEY